MKIDDSKQNNNDNDDDDDDDDTKEEMELSRRNAQRQQPLRGTTDLISCKQLPELRSDMTFFWSRCHTIKK